MARRDPYRAFRFRIEIQGLVQGGFRSVGGMERQTDDRALPRGRGQRLRAPAGRPDDLPAAHPEAGPRRDHAVGLAPGRDRRVGHEAGRDHRAARRDRPARRGAGCARAPSPPSGREPISTPCPGRSPPSPSSSCTTGSGASDPLEAPVPARRPHDPAPACAAPSGRARLPPSAADASTRAAARGPGGRPDLGDARAPLHGGPPAGRASRRGRGSARSNGSQPSGRSGGGRRRRAARDRAPPLVPGAPPLGRPLDRLIVRTSVARWSGRHGSDPAARVGRPAAGVAPPDRHRRLATVGSAPRPAAPQLVVAARTGERAPGRPGQADAGEVAGPRRRGGARRRRPAAHPMGHRESRDSAIGRRSAAQR